jgi:hypothetical protein
MDSVSLSANSERLAALKASSGETLRATETG